MKAKIEYAIMESSDECCIARVTINGIEIPCFSYNWDKARAKAIALIQRHKYLLPVPEPEEIEV